MALGLIIRGRTYLSVDDNLWDRCGYPLPFNQWTTGNGAILDIKIFAPCAYEHPVPPILYARSILQRVYYK